MRVVSIAQSIVLLIRYDSLQHQGAVEKLWKAKVDQERLAAKVIEAMAIDR